MKSGLQSITHRWKDIGLALGLDCGQLNVVERQNRDLSGCLTAMLTLWLNRSYNTKRFGEPSWELLASAVGHSAGGNNSALAKEITGGAYHSAGPVFSPSLSNKKHTTLY